jgi:hypothetical protein
MTCELPPELATFAALLDTLVEVVSAMGWTNRLTSTPHSGEMQ